MCRRILFVAALAGAPLATLAQSPPGADPADPKVAKPATQYRSAFKDYRPYTDLEIARWREVNDEMGRLNGHIGHVPGSVPPRAPAASAPKPPVHGERK